MSSASKTSFSPLLLAGLTAPLVIAVLGWLLQLLAKFPSRSFGASLKAVTFGLAPLLECLAVPAAVAVLVRRPESRTLTNVSLTAFCALVLLGAIFLILALIIR